MKTKCMSCGGSMKKMQKGGYPVKNFINNNLKPLLKIPRYPGETYKKDTGRNISEKAAARKVAKGKGFMTYQSNYKSDPEGTGDNKGIFNSNFIGRKPRIVMQKGGSKDKWGRSSSSDWYGFDPKNKKWTGNKALSSAELKALSHQKRGMGEGYGTYVKKSGSVMNDLGQLTSSQQTQLNKYMSKASLPKKIYEGLPNIGTIVGSSAADIPKGSKLKKQKIGGMVKKMQNGGSIKKKPLLPAPKSKTGMDALKALGKYVSTFGFATEGYNPAPSKKAKKTTPKMAVGGTTTKRIIKKSTGGMYGIPQENLGTSGQYGFAQKGGGVTSGIAKKIISTAKKSNPNIKNLYDKNGNKKSKAQFILQQMKTDLKNKTVKKYQKGGTHIMPNGKVMLDSKMKKGGATKAAKFAALAPPYDKATFADRIAGAKKSVKKKK